MIPGSSLSEQEEQLSYVIYENTKHVSKPCVYETGKSHSLTLSRPSLVAVDEHSFRPVTFCSHRHWVHCSACQIPKALAGDH